MREWAKILLAFLGIAGSIAAAVLTRKKEAKERRNEIKNDRKESADALDLDLEHLDRERLRRNKG